MTTVTIRLGARTARALAERAAREGRTLDRLLADLAEQAASEPPAGTPRPEATRLGLLERAALLDPATLGRDALYAPEDT